MLSVQDRVTILCDSIREKELQSRVMEWLKHREWYVNSVIITEWGAITILYGDGFCTLSDREANLFLIWNRSQ